MLQAIIVDDEKKARETLQGLLTTFCADKVTLCASVGTVKEGIQAIEKYNPDIVFLDIQMKGESGLQLLTQIGTINFSVIFTTAYDKYALHAIKFSAIDYILKPIDFEELIQAIEKVPKNNHSRKEQYANYIQYKNVNTDTKKIAITTTNEMLFVDVNQIIYCRSVVGGTQLITKDETIIQSTNPLKHFEDLLDRHHFFRIHNSYVVNLNEIETYNKTAGGSVVMSSKKEISISARRKADFLKKIVK